jgi:hypothetical protein
MDSTTHFYPVEVIAGQEFEQGYRRDRTSNGYWEGCFFKINGRTVKEAEFWAAKEAAARAAIAKAEGR